MVPDHIWECFYCVYLLNDGCNCVQHFATGLNFKNKFLQPWDLSKTMRLDKCYVAKGYCQRTVLPAQAVLYRIELYCTVFNYTVCVNSNVVSRLEKGPPSPATTLQK